LLLIARRHEVLEEVARDIEAQFRVAAIPVAADLLTPEAIPVIEAALAANRAFADVLINNAGLGLGGLFHAQAWDDVLRLLDLNVRATTELTHRFLPGMRARGRGGILNVASLGGYAPGPYQAAYYASKAYVLSLTQAVAAEVAGEGVRVAVLAPGPVNTDFHTKMGAETAYYLRLMPISSPQGVASSAYRGYLWGRRVIKPGLLTEVMALAMRVVPHTIVIPIIGWLLKPRGGETGDAGSQGLG
jgi:hypothetical protein